MATRHEIISIDFRANAAKANPAMDALREAAKGMNEEVEKTKEAIAKGIKTGMAQTELDNLGAKLKTQEKQLKSFKTAMDTLQKGVGTLSRAIDAFNNGSLSQMSAAFQKASYNAAENAKKALIPGTKDYEKNMAELDALQQKNLENLAKYKLRTEQMLKSIAEGGKISSQDLKQEADGIQELMRLLPHMGHEWMEYNQILTRVNDAVRQQADAEKRLKGAIVDASDAREEMKKLTREGAEAARQQHEQAEQEIATLQKEKEELKANRAEMEKQIAATRELVAEREKAVVKQEKSVKALEAQRDALARRKDEEHDPLNVSRQNADTLREAAQQQADNLELQRKKTKELGEEVDTLKGKLESLAHAEPVKPKVDTSEVERLKGELADVEQKLKNVANYKSGAQKTVTDYETKYGKTSEEQIAAQDKLLQEAIRRDTAANEEAVNKVEAKWKSYWEKQEAAAKKFAETLGKSLEELDFDDITKQLEGPMAEKAKSAYRVVARREYELGAALFGEGKLNQDKEWAKRYEGNDSPEAKVIESMQRKYREYTKELREANNAETEAKPIRDALKQESTAYYQALGQLEGAHKVEEGLLKQQTELQQQLAQAQHEATAAQEKGNDTDAETLRLKGELKKKEEEYNQSKADETRMEQELAETKQKSKTADEEAAKAEEDYGKAVKKNEEDLKLEQKGLEEKNRLLGEGNTTLRDQQKQLDDNGKAQDENARKTADAEQKKAQAQELTVKRMEDMLALLKEENRTDIPANTEKWRENEREIIRLTAALDEIKKKQAELQREPVERLMTERMQNLGNLSNAALQETKKFWQAMYDGAEKNDPELKKIEQRLKDIGTEEAKRSRESLRRDARSILGNQENMNEEELRRGIAAAKEYMQQFSLTGKVREKYNDAILRGTQLLKQYSTETMQAKQKEQELNAMMTGRLERLPKLSAAALEETKKYWQAQLAGAERGSEAYREIEARIKAVSEEQAKMSREQLKQTAKGVFGTYSNMSEGDLGNAIKAAKEYVLTLNSEGEARKKMNAAILEAEKYQKEHSLETERAKQKEQELNQAMTERMEKLPKLTSAALEETKKYWEAQYAGAEKGSQEAKEFEERIKAINEQQKQNRNVELRRDARSILGNQENMNEEELRRGIAAAKEYMQQFSLTGKVREKYNDAILRGEELLKRTGVEALRSAKKEAEAKEEAIRKEQELNQAMTDRMSRLPKLTAGALEETKKYWEAQLAGAERGSQEAYEFEQRIKAINEQQKQVRIADIKNTARSIFRDQTTMTEEELRRAIAAAKEYVQTFKVGGQVREMYNQAIARGEDLLKEYSVEQERAKQKEQELKRTMTDRLQNLSTLSADALAETNKYWDAQYRGAERSSQAFKDAEDAMKRINEQETTRKAGQATRVLSNMQDFGDAEIRQAVQTMEQLRDAQAHGLAQWEMYNKRVQEGKKYLDEWAETDRVIKFEGQMAKLPQLSDAALAETKKFWETMVAGAERGSRELSEYEAKLKQVVAEEQERQKGNLYNTAQGVFGNRSTMSEAELRKSVEAAKEYQKTLTASGSLHQQYSKAIAETEEYLKRYSVETARATVQQEELDREMKLTLTRAQGGYYDTASMKQLDDAIKKLKAYQATIQDPNGVGKATFEATKTQVEALTAQLNKLKGEAEQVKTGFASADEVIQRFNQHICEIKVDGSATKSFEEQLNAATSVFDDDIKREAENVDYYEQQIREATQELKKMEAELAELEKKHANSSWFRKQTSAYKLEAWRIDHLRESIEGQDITLDDGSIYNTGRKAWIEELKNSKATAQSWLDSYKQRKAAALGLTEAEEKVTEAHRMTREEIQQGIKVLEEEAIAQDRTTADGKKRWEELRQTIEAMKRELRESSGEILSIRDAYRVGLQGLGGTFKGSNEELAKAKKTLQETLAVTDKGSKRYMQLQRALNGIALEEKRVADISKEVQAVLDQPKGRSFNELKQAVEQGRLKLQSMDRTTKEGQKAFDELAKKIKAADLEMKTLGNSAKGTTSAFEKAWSRLKTYVTLYVGAAAALQKLTAAMGDLMEISDRMGEVRKTTGFTADEVGRLTTNLRDLDVRTSLTSLLETAAKAGQLGMKTQEDVQGFTEAANKLMIALPEMGNEAATEMMKVAMATGEVDKIRKQMDEGLIKGSSATAVALEKVGSTIDQLRANSAAAAPQITDFVKRLGAVGAQSGITIDQVAALGSTVDALGLRIEMSATALSRMIPAIKNNAFAVAKAIKVEPETLRTLFDTGRGMEAILMVFQHIKNSGMREDDIEKMLGMAGMQEVMKELNQMGARAGIVFAGLSQNVDMLREHLEIAGDAYEENMAIQREFQKMNETTAAKWERLKNELEEAFVGDQAQRWLGGIIDGLRQLVNIVSGNVEPALKSLNIAVWMAGTYFTAWRLGIGKLVVEGFGLLMKGMVGLKAAIVALTTTKGLRSMKDSLHYLALETKAYIALKWQLVRAHGAEEKAAIRAKLANNSLAKSMSAFKANVVVAVIAAIGMLIWKLHEWNEKSKEAAREAAKFQAELSKETEKVDKLFYAVGKASVKTDEATKKVEEARKALAKAKEQLDGSKESTDRLAKAEADLAEREEELRKKQTMHARSIQDINSQYGQYLGYMLSEVSSAKELAAARALINEKLRETITLKRKEAALERVEKAEGEKRDEEYADLYGMVTKNSYTQVGPGRLQRDSKLAATMMRDITDMAQNDYKSEEEFRKAVTTMLKGGAYKGNVGDIKGIAEQATDYYKQLSKIREKNRNIENQWAGEEAENRKRSQARLKDNYTESVNNYKKLELEYRKAQGDAKKQAAANLLKEMDTINEMVESSERHFETDKGKGYVVKDKNTGKVIGNEKGVFDQFINNSKGTIDQMKKQREQLLKEAGNLYQARKKVDGEMTEAIKDTTNGGWGADHEASSTDWKNMTAEQLVARRKQMKDFVNAIQTDTDVQSVLKEDAALKKAIEKGMSSDMRTVIEWYNTERLKIQDELHARHLTNTGDWMDPKKGGKKASKLVQDEMKYYLDELDAYYTERKAEIQEALNDEQISEAEARNRTLALEGEWYQRRGNLQKLYSKERMEVAEKERTAIFDILSERTGDSTDYIQKDIANTVKFIEKVGSEKGKAAMDKIYGDIDLGMERSFLKSRNAIGKHMQEITSIVNKENPYTGITETLRKELATMDVLLADIKDEEQRTVDKEIERTMFILEQSAKGYGLTWQEMMSEMAKRGWQAWADAIAADPQMQERLMHQTYKVFESVQAAIKKEAAQLKTQAENMWNNILMPGGDGKTTVKDAFEQAVSALGIEQGRVSRANSLIGAGSASERVADRLAIKQMQVQLAMQRYQYNLVRKIGKEKIETLRREADADEALNDMESARAKRMQAQNAEMALNLATRKQQTEELKLQEDIIAKTEESQNRLYQSLKEWGDLLASSVQSILETYQAGDAEYYNELAKLDLTGKGGPGAGTYIVIDNEGTEDAKAHYEYLDERQALERQHEIEQENARAEAWRKVMDDLNAKMNEQITDWMNAALQNAATRENTAELKQLQQKLETEQQKLDTSVTATNSNTDALKGLTQQLAEGITIKPNGDAGGNAAYQPGGNGQIINGGNMGVDENGVPNALKVPEETASQPGYTSPWQQAPTGGSEQGEWLSPMQPPAVDTEAYTAPWAAYAQASTDATKKVIENDKKAVASTQSSFAKMTLAANLYGIAYQTMSNDNLSTAQKVQLFAVQAAGNAAIAMLTTDMATTEGEAAVSLPGILGKAASQLGPIAGPIAFAAMSALLGGLMGLAVSKIAKSKSTISQATGASVSAGRLATGMLNYAEGNVNEFTDPATLTPGRQYNVDAADGRTYRARYMGTNPRTHITNGPEFHLSGERGREMIIDAGTTRQITMNEAEIWHAIQTLSTGGTLRHPSSLRRRGIAAHADGNLDEFEDVMGSEGMDGTGLGFDPAALQASLDRNSEVQEALLERLQHPLTVAGTGSNGVVAMYDKLKKEAQRQGVKYI